MKTRFAFYGICFLLIFNISSAFAEKVEKSISIKNDRTISIVLDSEAEVPSLTISDPAGPSEQSQFPKWAASRTLTNDLGPYDPKKYFWLNEPTAEQRRLPSYHAGSVRNYQGPHYQSPLKISLSPNSLEGWESIDFLRKETHAVAYASIEKLVEENKSRFEALYREGKKKLKEIPEDGRLSDQLSNLKSFLKAYLRYPPDADEMTRQSVDDMNSYLKMKRQDIELLNQAVLSGEFQPQKKLVPHYDQPLQLPLLVVHANWGGCKTESPIFELEKKMKELEHPIVHLKEGARWMKDETDLGFGGWPKKSHVPDVALFSQWGEHCIRVPSRDVVIVGSNWGQCHRNGIISAIDGHFAENESPFTIHIPAESVAGVRDSQDHTLNGAMTQYSGEQFYQKIIVDELFKNQGENSIKSSIEAGNEPNLSLNEFQFRISIDGKEYAPVGTGSKIVELKVWNQKHFINNVLPTLRK